MIAWNNANLLIVLFGILLLPSLVSAEQNQKRRSSLGIQSHASLRLGQEGFGVRGKSGLIVDSIESDSPAEKAGLKKGDMLIQIGENLLVSVDDLLDVYAVTKPKTITTVCFVRDGKEEKAEVILGSGAEIGPGSFVWDYAGLSQLSTALKDAKENKMFVLVGLSGSET